MCWSVYLRCACLFACLSVSFLASLSILLPFYYTLSAPIKPSSFEAFHFSMLSSFHFPHHQNYPSPFSSPSAFQLLPFHIKVKHPLLPRWGWDKYWHFIVFLGTHAHTTSNAHTPKHTHTHACTCVWVHSLSIFLHIFLSINTYTHGKRQKQIHFLRTFTNHLNYDPLNYNENKQINKRSLNREAWQITRRCDGTESNIPFHPIPQTGHSNRGRVDGRETGSVWGRERA